VTGAPPSRIAELHPAYFAMVMATGIVSIAALLLGMPAIAHGLYWLNGLFYVVLWVLTGLRIARYPHAVVADLLSHGRAVGFFTIVPATSVLGGQALLIGGQPRLALSLWIVAAALLFTLNYAIITLLTVKSEKPGLAAGLHGGWLLVVVAAQSVSVLGTQIAPQLGSREPHMLFFALVAWLVGGMMYLWVISLIFYRYMFFPMSPSDLSPPYWVNMGAVAISTLAGSLLILAAPHSALLTDLLPFLKGLTLFYWATASWWIPMLVILGAWRHLYRRFPIRYDPLYWGAVFPLGMYTVATFRLAGVLEAPFLHAIPRIMVYVALGAWAAVFLGLLWTLAGRARVR
jgi:tellurite resistance protein TehA-like permease